MLHRVDFYFYKFFFYHINFQKILILEFFFLFHDFKKKNFKRWFLQLHYFSFVLLIFSFKKMFHN